MAIHLLDVNVLLALFDPWHVFYKPAQAWFAANKVYGWATCPSTENGFIRISSHTKYPNRPGDANDIADRLRISCDDADHHFWPADVSITEIVNPGVVFTYAQVTDLYLLGLAIRKGGKLATLDRRIPASLIEGGERALTVISA